MLARLQQLLTLGLMAAALGWGWTFMRQGRPLLAAGGAALIVFGYALVLALESVMAARVNRDDAAPRAQTRQRVRAWLGEAASAPRVFCWRQPFRSRRLADFLPEGRRVRGVVLVHGFVCNRGFWNPWMERFRHEGVPHLAVNLEPVFGSIDAYVATVEAAVQRVETLTGQAPLVVAHSMGGLAVRAWLERHDAAARVHHVVTIASPHHGTWLARFAVSENGRQMRLGSRWLGALAAREAARVRAPFTCFWGHCDNIVMPASSATLPDADNRHLAGLAHVHMAFCGDVIDAVLRVLRDPRRPPTARTSPPGPA